MLTRNFIFKCLYEKKHGYFNQPNLILKKPRIPFHELRNKQEYVEVLDQLYSKNSNWTTPCEIFQPFYSICMNYTVSLRFHELHSQNEEEKQKVEYL
jgi:hypothetical protein